MNNIHAKKKVSTKLLTKVIAVSAITISSLATAYAEVTLQVDDNIKVTAINGQSVTQSAFQPLQKQFVLQPGKHVITAKYDRLYEFRNDQHDYLRSANITVTADMQDNQTYRLTMPGQPERYAEAKEFVKAPTLAVMKGTQVISQQQASGTHNAGIFSSIAGIFDRGDSAQVANNKAIAAINSQPTTTQAPVVSENASTLDKFMQLWLQATPQEREKIRQWVQQ